jgi:superfamily II DNA helicase RecQ
MVHLRDSHNLGKERRKPVLAKYGHLSLRHPKEVELPEPGGPPFAALGKPLDGFQCDDCDQLVVSKDSIQKHCKSHGWFWSKQDPVHWKMVKVQTFFGTGFQRYFIVKCQEEAFTQAEAVDDNNNEDAAVRDQLLREFNEIDERDAKRFEIADSRTEKSDNTGWWNFVQWRPHFGSRNIRRIAHASRLPDRKDKQLQRVSEIVDMMIKRAVDGLRSLHDDTPYWLRTANSTEKVENRPMVRLQNEDSLDRYIAYLRRFACYLLRVYAAQKERESCERAESESGGERLIDDNRELITDEVEEDKERDETQQSSDSGELDVMKDCCELTKFSPEQKQLLQDMLESLEAGENEDIQVQKMSALMMSMILQSLKGCDRFDSPVIHFAAVLGIVEDENRLRRGDEYSYMLAGLMYCVRVLFVEHTLPAATRGEQTAKDIDRFLELRKKYLVVGSYSPCSFLIKMLGYGKTMSMQKINQPSITWTRSETNRPDGDILEFHGKPLPIKQFKDAIHDMIREAEDILWKDLMWVARKKDRFEIDLDIIQDDLSLATRGASWVTNEANGMKDKREWMMDQMLKAPKDQQLWDRKKNTWRMTRVREYGQLQRRVKELMLAAGHMTPGPPGRGEEITPIRIRNGFLQERNIYVINGRVGYVTRYHKSQALFGEAKVIPRFLPWRVGQIWALYQAYVQPFSETLDQKTNGPPRSDHLWHDKNGSWTREHLTKVLTQETAIRLGVRLTTQDYRNVAIEMGREYIGAEFMRGLPMTEDMPHEDTDVIVSAVDLAAAHGKDIAERYGVRGDIIRNLSDESIRIFGAIGSQWHQLLGLDSKKPSPSTKHLRGLSYSTPQPSLVPKRSRSPLGRPQPVVFTPPLTGPSQPGLLTPLSSDLSEHGSPGLEPKGFPSRPRFEAATTGVLPLTTVPIYSGEEIREGLKKVLNQAEPEFRSDEQREAVFAALDQQTPLIVVLPTGGGKTLTFTLPAILRDPGVSIVVAPFNALEKDYVRRLRLANIEHVVWHHGETRYAPVVVVSADRAATTGFITYGSMLRKRKLLRRVVLDECHLSFTASDYRPKLRQLGHLQVLRCPIILLTATLPPIRLDELREVMHISDFRMIRTSTVRANIRYMVRRCPNKSVLKLVKEMARLRRLGPGERGIFYCSSRDGTEEVAKVLGCPYYHSMVDEKDAAVEKWLQDAGFMAATGALGTGGDYPRIVYIVHIGVPYGMIDFAQETGRGGRAGEEVDSIILLEDGEFQRLEKQDAAELTVDELAMQRFIQTRECRRFAMSGYLDEEGQTCEEAGGRLCDCCGGGVADWTAGQVRAAQELQRFEDKMNEVQRHCGFCWTTYGPGEAEHLAVECTRTEGLNMEQSEWLREGVRLDRRCRDCWKCGISQQICKGIENKQACRWAGVAGCLWLSWFYLPRAQAVLAEGGYSGSNITAYRKWLGLRSRQKILGAVVSNGMWVLWTTLPRDWISRRGVGEGERGEEVGVSMRVERPRVVVEEGELVGADDDIPRRREQVLDWLSRHCIYCEVTGAPQSYNSHWYKTCFRSKGIADDLGYEELMEWQVGMDEFRQGICRWCKKGIDQCGIRDSLKVSCPYGDVMMPVVFILYRQGWLKGWLAREGYTVGFGIAQVQRWLNEGSDLGGWSRTRAVEAFEAYAMEFARIGQREGV